MSTLSRAFVQASPLSAVTVDVQCLDLGWILIFKAITDPLAVLDECGLVVFANQAWSRMTGYETTVDEGQHITRVLPGLMFAPTEVAVPLVDVPMMIKNHGGQLRAARVSVRPVPGKALYVIQAFSVHG